MQYVVVVLLIPNECRLVEEWFEWSAWLRRHKHHASSWGRSWVSQELEGDVLSYCEKIVVMYAMGKTIKYLKF